MPSTEPPTIAEYRLRLEVDVARPRWAGSVEFDPPVGLRSIALDADGLEVRSVRCGDKSTPFRLRAEERVLEIDLPAADPGSVRIDFEGQVVDGSLMGLYRCPQGDGQMLTTQCAPIGAGRIFPCLDRPDRRARILLTVITDPAHEVVSNAPVQATRERAGRREWIFAPSPSMAPYLFYLAVGVFDHAEDRSGRVPVRALTPPGRGAAGRFAATSAARILAAYEAYYGIPYPLPKLDLIAVSEQAFGAMENWGAICFRDMRLLVDEASSSFARRDVFETISHEVAHQWFGNLVTMEWWDDIWLNESFAMLLETKITEALAPEFEPMQEFLLRPWGMGGALTGDSLRATHPVRGRVHRPEEISQIFDAISYGKGASVLRMLEGYLGAERFRAGVTEYLERFRFGNARTEDLWAALARSAGRPVAPLIGPWIDRAGLPVVSARLGAQGLELTQQRFTFSEGEEAEPWPIPLQIDVDGERRSLLFDQRELSVPVGPGSTVHLNPAALGFYRVRYDRPLLERLLTVLPARPPVDRWIVLNDLAAFVVAGTVDWTTYAHVVDVLGRTGDRLVVEELLSTLTDWALAFPLAAALQDLARRFLADHLDRVGLERRPGEREDDGILRESLAFSRARIDAGFARDLAERFVDWDHLDPDARQAVAVALARSEGEAGYDEILRATERATTQTERLRFERALAWSGEPRLLRRTLELVMSGGIRSGHVVPVLSNLAANPVGRSFLGPWLEEHLPTLATRFRGSGDLSLLLERTLPLVGLDRAAATREYFRRHSFPEGAQGIAKGLEGLELLGRLGDRLNGA